MEPWLSLETAGLVGGATDGCRAFGGCGEAIGEVASEDGCGVVMAAVDDHYRTWTAMTPLLFEGGYDGSLGRGELPAEILRESVTPDVGDGRSVTGVFGDEPHDCKDRAGWD